MINMMIAIKLIAICEIENESNHIAYMSLPSP